MAWCSPDHAEIWRVPSLDGVEAFRACFSRFTYARHSHDAYAIGMIDHGAMCFWHQGGGHTVLPGGVISINPGEVHDGHSASPDGCRYRMLYVERATIDQIFTIDAPRIRSTFALKGPMLRDARLAHVIRRFHATIEHRHISPISPLEQQSRLIQVLYLLFSEYGEPPLKTGDVTFENAYAKRGQDYLVEHLGDSVRLSDVAAAVGLSPFHFLRVFKRTAGMPPHAYQNQIRLEHARMLLRKGEKPAHVAAELGYSDQAHLTRRFKAAFGVTPRQYARALRV
jgi:AraC-like DNA-binding protein